MTQSGKDGIGHAIGSLLKEYPIATAAICVAASIGIYKETKPIESTAQYRSSPSKEEELAKDKERCGREKGHLLSEASTFAKQKNFEQAANLLNACSDISTNKDFDQKYQEYSLQHWTNVIKNVKASSDEKKIAHQNLATLDPKNAEMHRKTSEHFASLAKQKAERDAAAAERARKKAAKKAGVSVGMSQQEVLESSWGRPERVNRRVTANGVHEQWAYSGYNYLHFEDGVLTSIHTSKN